VSKQFPPEPVRKPQIEAAQPPIRDTAALAGEARPG
jgi:hypothetical protein